MTPRPLQPHFSPARVARGGALRASALRAQGTHLCELSDNHSSSDLAQSCLRGSYKPLVADHATYILAFLFGERVYSFP